MNLRERLKDKQRIVIKVGSSSLVHEETGALNLTKLESRPIPDTDYEFMFYLDVEGSLYDQRTLEFVCGLHQSLDFLEFLGNYQEHAK